MVGDLFCGSEKVPPSRAFSAFAKKSNGVCPIAWGRMHRGYPFYLDQGASRGDLYPGILSVFGRRFHRGRPRLPTRPVSVVNL